MNDTSDLIVRTACQIITEQSKKVWGTCQLQDLGKWATGAGFPLSYQGLTDLPYLFSKVSDMNLPGNEIYLYSTVNTVDQDTASKIGAKLHPAGTVIFPKIGGAIATHKRRLLTQETAIDNNCLGITPNPQVDSHWLYFYLRGLDFTIYQSGTSVPAIKQSTLGQIPAPRVPLPIQQAIAQFLSWLETKKVQDSWNDAPMLPEPLAEQRRIVGRIEELAGKVEEARRLRVAAASEAASLLTSVISNLAFDESCWENIETALAEKDRSVRSGPFGSQLTHKEFVDSGVMAIGTRDVLTNRFERNSGWYITNEKFQQFTRYQVFPGDVLVTIVGASIGRFCVVPDDIPLAFTTKHVVAITFNRQLLFPMFASYLLNYHRRCRESIFSQTAGSAQPSLNNTKVKAIEIPLPPLHEQIKMAERLMVFQKQIGLLQQYQGTTQNELDALLPSILDKAFKGEL